MLIKQNVVIINSVVMYFNELFLQWSCRESHNHNGKTAARRTSYASISEKG